MNGIVYRAWGLEHMSLWAPLEPPWKRTDPVSPQDWVKSTRAIGEQAFGKLSSREAGSKGALGVGLGREDGYCFQPLTHAGQSWQRPGRAESHLCSRSIPGTACPPWSPKANWTKQPVQEKTAGQDGFQMLQPLVGTAGGSSTNPQGV